MSHICLKVCPLTRLVFSMKARQVSSLLVWVFRKFSGDSFCFLCYACREGAPTRPSRPRCSSSRSAKG